MLPFSLTGYTLNPVLHLFSRVLLRKPFRDLSPSTRITNVTVFDYWRAVYRGYWLTVTYFRLPPYQSWSCDESSHIVPIKYWYMVSIHCDVSECKAVGTAHRPKFRNVTIYAYHIPPLYSDYSMCRFESSRVGRGSS